MKTTHKTTFLAGFLLAVLAGGSAFGATTIISDNYTGSGTGVALGSGLNSGITITPPATRLTGTATANLRYINTGLKVSTVYSITSNKARVGADTHAGRLALSADGTAAFDFAAVLGANTATPANPVVYDIAISMANSDSANNRMSFGIATVDANNDQWDFGIQVYRVGSDTVSTIGKLIDSGSSGVTDIKAPIQTTALTVGTEIAFLIRVTDAGAETSGYHSRVQVSTDAGATWLYDTATDSAVPNGWRFDAAPRYIIWDQAQNANPVTYDNFSVRFGATWTGGAGNNNWSAAANWESSLVPAFMDDNLIFSGSTRLTPSMNNSYSARRLEFDASAGSFTISATAGKTLTMNGDIFQNSANAQTLNTPISIATTRTINTASGSLTIGGAISGTGGITKSGNYTLTLGGASTYDGDTTVSAGTLLVNGSIGSGAVSVVSGGTLGGAGTIGGEGTVQSSGTLAPGNNTIGMLTINNTLALNTDSTAAMEIKTVSGTCSSDRVAGATAVSAAGALNVTLDGTSDSLAGGESFTLFNVAPSGTFASTSLPSLGTGLNWWTPDNYATIKVNRAPLAEHKTYTRTPGMTVKIRKTDLMLGASDPDTGDGDSATYEGLVSLTSNQGVTVSQDGTYYFYVPINDNDDNLQYKVTDNRGGLTTRDIYINVRAVTGEVQTITPDGGQATVKFAGIPGGRYDVQRATSQPFTEENTTTVLSTNAPAGGLFLLVEPMILPQAYYRLKYPGTPAL